MAITRINEFHAIEGKGDALAAVFGTTIVPSIRQAAGCISCELLRSVDEPGRFAVVEVWDSVEAHKASLAEVPPELFLQVKPLLSTPPTGHYYRAG
ncbi:putative quinol monooxygenase [Andreprevotia chitinilytica]|uniref:putative quinol monooxygenase n=1 Tax=Andreprevotia chitinilytica TaxID=396808 RepID=UPI000557F389|nr:antibiotic biosynthesis monooxygenase family protein [Andreprevotia chitinilytica]